MNNFKDLSSINFFYLNKCNLHSKLFFKLIVDEFPLFFRHIFGICDKNRSKWRNISSENDKGMISIVPNGLFSKLETIDAIVTFLSKDPRMVTVFVVTLIEECTRNFWVDLLPTVIFLSLYLNNPKANKEDYQRNIMDIYRINSRILDKLVVSVVREGIYKCVKECYDDIESIQSIVSRKILNNQDFQDRHTTWEMFTFTADTCLCKTKIISWSQMEDIEIDEKNCEILIQYREGIAPNNIAVKMKSKENCETTFNVLQFQLNLMKPYYCKKSWSYNPNSCVKDHWIIGTLLSSSSMINFSQLTKRDYCKPPYLESLGNNCYIKIVSLQVELINAQHVCIKELLKTAKSKIFWNMIYVYRNWCHPNILKFYGLVEYEFAIFRECSTGPLITYLVKGSNEAFSFKDVLMVLLNIGNALYYLHDGLKQTYGNLTLQRIMMIGSTYKLCEPSLDKRIDGHLKSLKNLKDDLIFENCTDERLDLLQLLYYIIAIFYINDEMCNEQICAASFERTKCNVKMKSLINRWLSNNCNVENILEDLTNATFTDEEMNCIIVTRNNRIIPEFLVVVARDANMYEVINIDFNRVELGQKIGEGHFSEVFSALYNSPSNDVIKVAAKKINKTKEILLNELRPSTMVQHKNVLKFIGFSKKDDFTYLITELGESCLRNYLRKNKPNLSKEQCLDFSKQICTGMQFMSDINKIIHRDLAARNVIMFKQDKTYLLKISDFGLSILLKDDTTYYQSDESVSKVWLPSTDIKSQKYSLKTDIYSFGVLLWEIYSQGESPKTDLVTYNGYGKEFGIIKKCRSEKEEDRPANFSAVMTLLRALE